MSIAKAFLQLRKYERMQNTRNGWTSHIPHHPTSICPQKSPVWAQGKELPSAVVALEATPSSTESIRRCESAAGRLSRNRGHRSQV